MRKAPHHDESCLCASGNLNRNCTENGWSDVYPVINVACWSNDTAESATEVSSAASNVISPLNERYQPLSVIVPIVTLQ